MDIAFALLVPLAACGVVWNTVSTLLVFADLRRRGQKVSFLWLRTMSPWYVSRYREITKSETGKVGPLFYHWVVSINLVLLCVVAAVLVRYC